MTNITRFTSEEEWETRWLPDIDRLRLGAVMPGVPGGRGITSFRVGRFATSDPTGLVFTGRVDGSEVTVELPRVDLRLAGGYTGLIGEHNSAVVMSSDDRTDRSDDDVYLAPPRALVLADAGFPELFGRQDLTLGAAAQFDLRDVDPLPRHDGDTSELLNSQYGYLGLDGPLFGAMYYDAAAAAGVNERAEAGEDFDLEVGLVGLLETRYYFGAGDSQIVRLRSIYGTGETGELNTYVPVSIPDSELLRSYEGGDLTLATLEYSIRPFQDSPRRTARSLQFSTYGSAAFTAEPNFDDELRAVESGARLRARPASDFGGQLWVGAVFPGDEELEEIEPDLRGRLELSMSY